MKRTRRMPSSLDQLGSLLKARPSSPREKVPDKILSFHVEEVGSIIVTGTHYGQPIRFEISLQELTRAGREMGLLKASEAFHHVVRGQNRKPVFLVTALDSEGNPLVYNQNPIHLPKAKTSSYLKGLKPKKPWSQGQVDDPYRSLSMRDSIIVFSLFVALLILTSLL